MNADTIRVKLLSFDAPQLFNTEISNWRITSRIHIWRPYTDVYETEDAYTVRVEIAGMRNADFTLSLEGRFLVIRGLRPDVSERRAYHQMEIPFGEFFLKLSYLVQWMLRMLKPPISMVFYGSFCQKPDRNISILLMNEVDR